MRAESRELVERGARLLDAQLSIVDLVKEPASISDGVRAVCVGNQFDRLADGASDCAYPFRIALRDTADLHLNAAICLAHESGRVRTWIGMDEADGYQCLHRLSGPASEQLA